MLSIEHMKYLIAELATQLNLPELQLDQDECCFVAFDTQAINIQFLEGQLCITTHVATLSPEEPIGLYKSLLATNLYGISTRAAFIALEPETESIVLQYMINDTNYGIDSLITALENLLFTANYLRDQIAHMQKEK